MDLNTVQNIIYAVAGVACVGACLYFKNIPQAKKIVLALVVDAEKQFGAKTGDQKYSYVAGMIYPKLPAVVRTFVTESTLRAWIEEGVEALEAQLQASSQTVSVTVDATQPSETSTSIQE